MVSTFSLFFHLQYLLNFFLSFHHAVLIFLYRPIVYLLLTFSTSVVSPFSCILFFVFNICLLFFVSFLLYILPSLNSPSPSSSTVFSPLFSVPFTYTLPFFLFLLLPFYCFSLRSLSLFFPSFLHL